MHRWPHGPAHFVKGIGSYILTAATYEKEHLFLGKEKLDYLTNHILATAEACNWALQAWAIFPNHYHLIAFNSPESAELKLLIKNIHGGSSRELNKMDDKVGRTVWHQYWDTRLTYERSYFARLRYVHQNAVRHGLVRNATSYQWCSAAWFEKTAPLAMLETVNSFPIDNVNVPDDF
jgi:putative transposase